ncbi:MAG: hypothetical protein WBB67_03330 [bacterium]
MKQEEHCWEWSNVYKDESEIDEETRQINFMQEKLGRIHKWASDVRQQITCISPCGHYSFPEQIELICKGIGDKRPAPNFRGCYQVSPEVKKKMEDYLFCLTSWLSNRNINAAIVENPLCEDLIKKIYLTLGNQNDLKNLLVERLIKRHEWWLKVIPLDTWSTRKTPHSWYNEPEGIDLFSDEYKDPEIKLLEEKIRERLKETSEIFIKHIRHSWLCHYKAFRYIEIAIHSIGCGKWGAGINRRGLDREKIGKSRDKYIICFNYWLNGEKKAKAIPRNKNDKDLLATIYSTLGGQNNVSIWLVSALRKTIKIFRDRQNSGESAF